MTISKTSVLLGSFERRIAMKGYRSMEETDYIKEFCDGKYAVYREREANWEWHLEFKAYSDLRYAYDEENKIEVYCETPIGD